MDLLAYFRVLRRRWLLILILMLVGAGLGVASTQFKGTTKKEPTFYKATGTLLLDPSSSSYDQSFTNIDQVTILATTGDVPNAVAKKLGTSETGRQLAEHIITQTNNNNTTNTIELTATDADEPGQ